MRPRDQWGEVPVDGDVIPFSRIPFGHAGADNNKKRHHFISVTYMRGFANEDKVWVYRSEDPENPRPERPEVTGYENYYYSTTLPDGSRNNHQFEDLWGVIESAWPATLKAVKDRRLSPAISFNVLGLATLMKTRVPAARDRHSQLIAAELRAGHQALERLGALPENMKPYAGLFDRLPVATNPERTLPTMFADMEAFGGLCFRMGFEVLHNESGEPFITSDNPVCVYDPGLPVHRRQPYEFDKRGELIFPLDAWTLLRGCTRLAPVNQIVRHRTVVDSAKVRGFNRTVAQFGYRLLIARDAARVGLASHFAGRCPTITIDVRFTGPEGKHIEIHWRNVFGPRPAMPLYVNTPERAARVQAKMEADGILPPAQP